MILLIGHKLLWLYIVLSLTLLNPYEAQGRDKIKGVVWPPCLAILCYTCGDVAHVVYMCERGGGGISLGEVS